MFGVLASAIYNFSEKHTKNQKHLTRNYFFAFGGIWGIFLLIIALFGNIRDLVAGEIELEIYLKVLAASPVAGFILGMIFAFFPWLTGLRHSDPPSEKK